MQFVLEQKRVLEITPLEKEISVQKTKYLAMLTPIKKQLSDIQLNLNQLKTAQKKLDSLQEQLNKQINSITTSQEKIGYKIISSRL